MDSAFDTYLDALIDQHLPVAFLDYDALLQFKKILSYRGQMGRKEVLILAYIIGANSKESNVLLTLQGHPPLYCKRREDAIWKFALDQHWDSATVINMIFLQNVDEKRNDH